MLLGSRGALIASWGGALNVMGIMHVTIQMRREEPWGDAAFRSWEEAQGAAAWTALGAATDDLHPDLANQQAFRRLQREEDERKGDFSGMDSRYVYCKFAGPSLRVSKAIRNQAAKPRPKHPRGSMRTALCSLDSFFVSMLTTSRGV